MTAVRWGALLLAGVLSGLVQSSAGVAMYAAGLYFVPWSMGVSAGVVYAGYNLISIACVYPDFLDQVARATGTRRNG